MYIVTITQKHKEIMYGMAINQSKDLSTKRIQNGQELFKMDIDTGTIGKADYVNEMEIGKYDKPVKHLKLAYDIRNIYVISLNLKNAKKQFERVILSVDFMVKRDEKELHSSSLEGEQKDNNTEPINTV